MFNNLRRDFGRIVKQLKGEPLTTGDLSEISCSMQFGAVAAKLERDGEHWSIYRDVGVNKQIAQGLTTLQAVAELEKMQDVAGQNINVPYNHFARVKKMLETEAAAPRPPVMRGRGSPDDYAF